jgi:hypothetical protein
MAKSHAIKIYYTKTFIIYAVKKASSSLDDLTRLSTFFKDRNHCRKASDLELDGFLNSVRAHIS